jgi:hypothetical protein
VLERATEIDPGVDSDVFADMIDNVGRYTTRTWRSAEPT